MESCSSEWFEILSAFRDGEVSREDAARVEAHLATCGACRSTASSLAKLGQCLAASRGAPAPDHVVARARRATSARPPALRRRRAAAVAMAFAASVGALALVTRPTAALTPAMAEELVRHHVVGFARERPCEFESSDPAAVAQWVHDKLGYALRIEPPAGARLLGARVCSVARTRTAALMYETDTGPLTVFAPPEGSSSSMAASELAHTNVGCTRAPLGSAICASLAPAPVFAVAETDPTTLAHTLAARAR